MNREELLARVKDAVRRREPEATVVLYGSRARGTAVQDSDWDFLVLVDGPVTEDRAKAVRHLLYEIEWDCGEVISVTIRNREEWASPKYQRLPFHQEVERYGIVL